MKRRTMEYRIRQISAIIMLIAGILIIISGIVLFGIPEGPGSGEAAAIGISKNTWIALYQWTGFIASGILVIHLYLNRRPVIRYFKEILYNPH